MKYFSRFLLALFLPLIATAQVAVRLDTLSTANFLTNGNRVSIKSGGIYDTNFSASASNYIASLAGSSINGTNILSSRIVNVRDYGATGVGNQAIDSPAILRAVNVWTNRGGILYFPQGSYSDTNVYSWNNLPNVGNTSPFEIAGDGMAASVWLHPLSNTTFVTCTNFIPGLKDLTIQSTGTNCNGFFMSGGAYPTISSGVQFVGWKGIAFNPDSVAGGQFEGKFYANGIGLNLSGYCDGWDVSVRSQLNAIGVKAGGDSTNYPGTTATGGGRIHIMTVSDGIAVQVVGRANGITISGYGELATNAYVVLGDLPGQPVTPTPHDVNIVGLSALGSATNTLVKVYTNVGAINIVGAKANTTMVEFVNASADTSKVTVFGSYGFIKLSSGVLLGNYSGNNYSYGQQSEYFFSNNTNRATVFVGSTGAFITNGGLGVNSALSPGVGRPGVVSIYGAGILNFAHVVGDTYAANTTKNIRTGFENYGANGTPSTLFFYNSTSTADDLNIGGGTSVGFPMRRINFYSSLNNKSTGAGQSIATFWENGSMTLGRNASANSTSTNSLRIEGSYQQTTNRMADWPVQPDFGGGFAFVNSNGTPYVLLSGALGTTWASTNALLGSGSGTTYTNNETGLPGVINGSGIGTNITIFPLLPADNVFSGIINRFDGVLTVGGLTTLEGNLNGTNASFTGSVAILNPNQGTSVATVGLDSTGKITTNGVSGGSGAATDSAFVTIGTPITGLTGERTLTGTANQITVTDGGANGTATLSIPSGALTTNQVAYGLQVMEDLGIGGVPENSGKNPSVLQYGTNSSGQVVIFRTVITNSLLRIDSSVNGAAYGNPLTYTSAGALSFPSTLTVGSSASAGRFTADSVISLDSVASGKAIIYDAALTGVATLQWNIENQTKTTNYTLVALDGAKVFNNNGASGATTNTLPAAVVGMRFGFRLPAAQLHAVKAVGSDVFTDATLGASSAAGTISSSTQYGVLDIECNVAGQWTVKNSRGTWAY